VNTDPNISFSYIEYIGGESEARLEALTVSIVHDDAVHREITTLKPGERRIVVSPHRPESVDNGVPLVWVDRTAPKFLGTVRARGLAPWLVDIAIAESQGG
jgi:hypothetical protein